MQTILFEYLNKEPVLFWLLAAFALATLVQMLYSWVFFARLSFSKPKAKTRTQAPVSVVLNASNQGIDLEKNLPAFLGQDYPDFEVVVVIDNSDDGSDELLEDLAREHSNLKIVHLRQNLNWFSGRKFPLSLGIKSASNDLILLSDPGCRPESKNWISEMAAAYQADQEIVLGYASFATKSSINLWLRFTAFYDALFYLSMALSGRPFKGIGKNLSYSRQLFYANKGFSSHYTIRDGDDELFVNMTAKKTNTRIQVSEEAKLVQIKKVSFAKWLGSEKSRLRIRRFFKFRDRLLISTFSFSAFAFYGLFAALLILQAPLIPIFAIFALRFISMMLVFGFALKRLGEKKLLLLAPFFELFLIIIDAILWFLLLFKPKRKWA